MGVALMLVAAPALAAAEAAVTAASAVVAASPGTGARPRIGLVLGGGGARGAAHIGVLEVLESLRVPVDCVAGTSMGALVAGAWAAGLSPAEMRKELAQADWRDMFLDNPAYDELNFRSKRLQQRFLPGSETGITPDGAVTPPGVVAGQKIKLFFNHLVRADSGERELQQLPLPVSIVATDIGTGERVVLRDGSLTQAMRASMSVPGLMAPLDYRGRRLVDGGLVDNLPIREVRERCGADIVIAVNVGSPPLPPEQVTGLLSITAQMVVLLTEQNVTASLATLRADDIYLKPELGDLTASDFERHAEAADRGRAAAQALVDRLAPLGVNEPQYAAWQRRVAVRERDLPRIDEVEIAGLSRVNPEVLLRYVEQQAGAPLDTATLNRDLLRAYGDGHYEQVDYTVLTRQDKKVLRLLPVEKSWGPDYLRMALRLESNLSQGSSYQLRLGYQKTWLNRLGGELLLVGQIGSRTGAGAEWYQPLDSAQRGFVSAALDYGRERNDYWFVDQRIAEYSSTRTRLDLAAGVNFRLLGQLRLGWRETQVTNSLETGVDIVQALAGAAPERASGGWLLALDLEQADRLYFPSLGWSLQASYYDSPRRDYSRVALEARGAVPWERWVLSSRLSWTGSPRGRLPLTDAARLGGLLNLTGFASGQLIGDDVAYGHVRAERVIGRAPVGLRGELRLGLALEAGKVGIPYTVQRSDGWLNSVAVYLAGETPVGPVFLGIGRGSGGSVNAYLVVGVP
ncbi:MAG: patatin-like phospholipase family protein [Betaproteobacteria bacterium]|nr:patatin-like phospholipase family protein [Betaproteobacteria bacterium]